MPSFLSPLARQPDAACSLRNRRTGAELARHLEPAFDRETRNRGLLGRESLDAGSALVLAPCNSVHTWFMRFPIDLLFVTKDGIIKKVRRTVRPWRMALSWGVHAVIELPAGSVGDCRPGDTVEVIPNIDS